MPERGFVYWYLKLVYRAMWLITIWLRIGAAFFGLCAVADLLGFLDWGHPIWVLLATIAIYAVAHFLAKFLRFLLREHELGF